MKLRKQTGLKSAILAAATGLLLAFAGLIRSEAGTELEPNPPADAPDYESIFAPLEIDQTNESNSSSSTRTGQPKPDTRTRAS